MNHYLKTVDDDIRMAELYAKYWIAMATTGVGRKRSISHGTVGPELTDEEKDADCMSTAYRHIRNTYELIERKKEMLCDELKDN